MWTLHVQVARDTTIEEGHAIAHEVEAALRAEYGQITDVIVHVKPEALESRARAR